MATPNLGIGHVAPTQANKTVTLNDSADALDNASNNVTSIAVSGTVNVTATQFTGAAVLRLTGTPGVGFTVNVPATKRLFVVHNLTDGAATVQVTGGVGDSYVVAEDEASLLFSDGADVAAVAGGPTGPEGPEGPQGLEGIGSSSNWSTPFRGATAYFTTDPAAQDLNSAKLMSWDAVENDTDSFWSAGNPTRLTIPAGITKVRIHSNLEMNATGLDGANIFIAILKNNARAYRGGGTRGGNQGFTNMLGQLSTGVVDVVEGDYFELQIQLSGQTSEVLSAGECYLQIEVIETEDAVNPPEEISGFFAGVPGSSAILVRRPLARATTFAAALAGSYGTATVAATAETDFDIQQDGVSIGTMRFAAAATEPTFISSGASFDEGDIFSIISPASPDATLANVGFVIAGVRT